MCFSSKVPPPPPAPEPLKELDEKTRAASDDARRKAALASGLESTWTRNSLGKPTATSAQATKGGSMGGS
jgi:hypothetical protein